MGLAERKRMHSKMKTKRKTRDVDQVEEDLKPENVTKMLNQPVDLDQTGAAQYYCVHCARYFVNESAMKEHFKTKPHRRRLKALGTEAYSQKEAEAAAGMGSYVAPRKRKVETQETNTPEAMVHSDSEEPEVKRGKSR